MNCWQGSQWAPAVAEAVLMPDAAAGPLVHTAWMWRAADSRGSSCGRPGSLLPPLLLLLAKSADTNRRALPAIIGAASWFSRDSLHPPSMCSPAENAMQRQVVKLCN